MLLFDFVYPLLSNNTINAFVYIVYTPQLSPLFESSIMMNRNEPIESPAPSGM